MNSGTIKFFNATKGFGFVTPDDGGADVFLPAIAVTGAGVKAVKPGQRITFEQAPDTKGPKVVSLKLVGDAPAQAPATTSERLTIYCDASADVTTDVVEAVQDSGLPLITRDYITAPPGIEELRRLSQLLSASGQSLVRRYDPLFLALRLDDRFITDLDFWTAIVEHPTLINGPVLVASDRARVCKTANEARAFLRKDDAGHLSKTKTLSPRIAAMLRGDALPEIKPDAIVAPVALPLAPAPLPAKVPALAKAATTSKVAKPKSSAAAAPRPAKALAKKATAKKPAKPAKPVKTKAKPAKNAKTRAKK